MVYIEQEGDAKTIFWNCPHKFIPASIWSFKMVYDHYKKHPGAQFPGLEDASWRYLLAEQIYEGHLVEYMRQGEK